MNTDLPKIPAAKTAAVTESASGTQANSRQTTSSQTTNQAASELASDLNQALTHKSQSPHAAIATSYSSEQLLEYRMLGGCPCCEYITFLKDTSDTYNICPVCYWENESDQLYDPSAPAGGANSVSLNQARQNFLSIGASDEQSIPHVRKPLPKEFPPR